MRVDQRTTIGRPQEWIDIPSWSPYQAHPDNRVRKGKYVLRQFVRDGITYVRLYKDLITHRQLFVVPVNRLMVWTFGARCIVCDPKPHNRYRHAAVLESTVRSQPVPPESRIKIFH